MFRPSLNEYSEGATLDHHDPVPDDYDLNHYSPSAHAPIDNLPIHQMPGHRVYPSVLMDSDVGPAHRTSKDTRLTIGQVQVHTRGTGKEGTYNPGDMQSLHLEDEHYLRVVRSIEETRYQPDVFLAPVDPFATRRIFNSFDPSEPVTSYPYQFYVNSGMHDRSRYAPAQNVGNALPVTADGTSLLSRNSAGRVD